MNNAPQPVKKVNTHGALKLFFTIIGILLLAGMFRMCVIGCSNIEANRPPNVHIEGFGKAQYDAIDTSNYTPWYELENTETP